MKRVCTFAAVLICILPWPSSASQVPPSSFSASSGMGSPDTALPKVTPFARRTDSPTVFPFMWCRYVEAQQAIRGYQRSGVPLVALQGEEWQPAAKGEEPAFAYFIPEIARFTHADLDHAINIFLILLLAMCFSSGAVGTVFWLQNLRSRIAAVIGLVAILVVTSLVGDIYMAESAVVVAVIPWALYFSRQKEIGTDALIYAFFAGLAAALANLTRMHAGTPVILFLAVLLFAFRGSLRKRALFAVLVLAGLMVPIAYFQVLVSRRDAALIKVSPAYRPIVAHHPFWHTIYGGLGYLNNDYGLKVDDETVNSKVRSIRPSVEYLSPEYESILRTETFRFAKSHPRFIFETFVAKSGLLFMILLVCANVGLASALLYRKPWAVEAAFWLVFAFTATNGLLATPNPDYLLGYMTFAVLYGSWV